MTLSGAQTLEHQAFLYGSVDDFVHTMTPFVRRGLELGDRVFAATHRANLEGLREELGPRARDVQLEDTTEWCNRPYDRMQAFRKMVAGLRPGERLRAMGEPVWHGSPAARRQWARYESIINVALAEAPMLFVCLYDASALPDDILAHASHTHPERVEELATVPSDAYVSPHEFVPGPASAPPADPAELPVDGARLRAQLAEHARAAGLGPSRTDELLLAATEVVTNALRHGESPVRAHTWVADGELIVRVTDGGSGPIDPLAGWVPPADFGSGGWGLAIARQLCDALEVVPSPEGTTVSLHLGV